MQNKTLVYTEVGKLPGYGRSGFGHYYRNRRICNFKPSCVLKDAVLGLFVVLILRWLCTSTVITSREGISLLRLFCVVLWFYLVVFVMFYVELEEVERAFPKMIKTKASKIVLMESDSSAHG